MKVVWLKPEKGMVSIGRKLIAEELGRRGVEVRVIEVSIRGVRWLAGLLKEDFDAVIGTTHLGLVLGGIIAILRGKPFIADFVDEIDILWKLHGRNPLVFALILLELVLLRAARSVVVIPMSQRIRTGGRVFRATLCTDVERFLNVSKRDVENAVGMLVKAGVRVDRPKVVYVGGFNKIYNLDVLLKAMRRLPEFELILIGGGDEEEGLRRLKANLNLTNVHFLGYVPHEHVPAILSACDVGVTLAEVPRQLKIYEYLASGLRVVVPESVANSDEFEFSDYCVGVKVDEEDVANGIRKAVKLGRISIGDISHYSCRRIAGVYLKAIRCAVDEGSPDG